MASAMVKAVLTGKIRTGKALTRPILSSTTLIVAALLAAIPRLALADVGQTDWSGGGGVPGPVTAWGNRFEAADGASWLAVPGQIGLSSSALVNPPRNDLSGAYTGSCAIDVGDVDNDGDIDVVGTATTSAVILLWENEGGDPITWTEQVVATPPGAAGVDLADLDGDGRLDVVVALIDPRNKIVWKQNLGGDPIVWGTQTIEPNWGDTWEMWTGDVNGDGHLDVMATKWLPGEVAWWQNSGTTPIVWTKRAVAPSLGGAHSVRGADLDKDGDMDLAVAAGIANKILVYWSDGANPPTWSPQVLDSLAFGARSVWIGDIDGDSNLDVAGIWWENHIAWWRNSGGSTPTWTLQVVSETAYGGHGLCMADVNGDGRLDILGASVNGDKIAWYENGGGSPITWTEHILSGSYDGATGVRAADLDSDGDLEVVGVAYTANLFSWWEATQFDSAGSITSSILDTEVGAGLGSIGWTSVEPSGTSLSFQVRSSDNPDELGAWSDNIAVQDCLPAVLGRYIQYQVFLGTSRPDASPILKDVTFTSCTAGVKPADRDLHGLLLTPQPNPCHSRVTVSFRLEAFDRVRLSVFDVAGRLVRDLASGWLAAGDHEITWDGLDSRGKLLSSGTYWLRLETPKCSETREIVLIR